MAFTVKKNPTQKFQYESGMQTLSGKNTSESHTGHLHTDGQNLSVQQFGSKIMPTSRYVNVAAQMVPPSQASNTAASTKA
jgi:hypothetical protein